MGTGPAQPKEIVHYFSVTETPNLRIQPTGRSKHPTIPETPEPEENDKIKSHNPTSGKDVSSQNRKPKINSRFKENTSQDDQIIQELMYNQTNKNASWTNNTNQYE